MSRGFKVFGIIVGIIAIIWIVVLRNGSEELQNIIKIVSAIVICGWVVAYLIWVSLGKYGKFWENW